MTNSTDVAEILAQAQAVGTVTVFDGGDGATSTWQTALSGQDVVVLPSNRRTFAGGGLYIPGGGGLMSDGAMGALKQWAEAGGTVVGTYGPTQFHLIQGLHGPVNSFGSASNRTAYYYADSTNTASIAGAPAFLVPPTSQASGWDDWKQNPACSLSRITPYYNSSDDSLAVGSLEVGSGQFVYLAYEWWTNQTSPGWWGEADWNATFALALQGQFPYTGTPISCSTGGSSGSGGSLPPSGGSSGSLPPSGGSGGSLPPNGGSGGSLPPTSGSNGQVPTINVPITTTPAAAQSARIELGMSSGQRVSGGAVAVTATGLQPGAAYSLVVRSTPQTVLSGNVPPSGALAAQGFLPQVLATGWHSATLTSTWIDGSGASFVLWFRIDSAGNLASTATTDPTDRLASTGAEAMPGVAAGGLALAGGIVLLTIRRRRSASR